MLDSNLWCCFGLLLADHLCKNIFGGRGLGNVWDVLRSVLSIHDVNCVCPYGWWVLAGFNGILIYSFCLGLRLSQRLLFSNFIICQRSLRWNYIVLYLRFRLDFLGFSLFFTALFSIFLRDFSSSCHRHRRLALYLGILLRTLRIMFYLFLLFLLHYNFRPFLLLFYWFGLLSQRQLLLGWDASLLLLFSFIFFRHQINILICFLGYVIQLWPCPTIRCSWDLDLTRAAGEHISHFRVRSWVQSRLPKDFFYFILLLLYQLLCLRWPFQFLLFLYRLRLLRSTFRHRHMFTTFHERQGLLHCILILGWVHILPCELQGRGVFG